MHLVVYGSFNCPYSFLASRRARRPPVQPDTTAAVAGYAALSGTGGQQDTDRLRAALFEALWVDGLDIGDTDVLGRLDCPSAAPGETMQRWQSQWESTERRVVPMMILEDGTLSRGLGALERLADFGGTEVAR